MADRQNAGVEDAGRYLPIKDFVAHVHPTKSAREHFVEECTRAFPSMAKHVCWLADESTKVATSCDRDIMGSLTQCQLFAVVAYTLDVDMIGGTLEENFYWHLNLALRSRDAVILAGIENYLHYFMAALHAVQPSEGLFYRGVSKSAFEKYRSHYSKTGKKIHWSGITSTSVDYCIAESFAGREGPGGVIFKIRAQSARAIHMYSAKPDEAEVLLLPNFKAVVVNPVKVDQEPDHRGYHIVEMVEVAT
eukprot:5191511-Amphidinium_carterae.1